MDTKVDLSYRDAGVDIDFASLCLHEIDKTRSRMTEIIKSPNDFAGLFSMKELCKRFDDPVLVSGTDGVGTKLLVAIECERYEGIGQDLVAMCVNDIATKGAEPLFFLDYFATANLRSVPFIKIVNSIVAACDRVNCALLGGETAEMPSLYAHKHFDLAGFAVGVVDRCKILGAHLVKENDIILGISSDGLHSNGYSLVRKIMFETLKHKPHDVLWQTERGVRTVADELLAPTKLYSNAINRLMRSGVRLSAVAHITGGGLLENIPRVLPLDLMASIDLSGQEIPRIFSYLMEHGPVPKMEMLRVFNMGIGLIIILPNDQKELALSLLTEDGENVFEIGVIKTNEGGNRCQVKI